MGTGEIDLAQQPYQELPQMGGAPDTPPTTPPEPNYPTASLEGGPELASIPDTGTSVIKHKVIGRHMHTTKGGKKKHRVEIQLHSIKPHKSAKRNAKATDEEAMAGLMQNPAAVT